MFKYIIISALTLISFYVEAKHTLLAANAAVSTVMQPILGSGCSITDRINVAAVDTDDIVVVVTTTCEGGNGFTQYMINTYTVDSTAFTTTPFIVGSGFDFVAETITITNNTVELHGRQWTAADAHCCPSLVASRSYILNDHKFKEKQ